MSSVQKHTVWSCHLGLLPCAQHNQPHCIMECSVGDHGNNCVLSISGYTFSMVPWQDAGNTAIRIKHWAYLRRKLKSATHGNDWEIDLNLCQPCRKKRFASPTLKAILYTCWHHPLLALKKSLRVRCIGFTLWSRGLPKGMLSTPSWCRAQHSCCWPQEERSGKTRLFSRFSRKIQDCGVLDFWVRHPGSSAFRNIPFFRDLLDWNV